LFFLHECGEPVELPGPEPLVLAEPLHGVLHALRRQSARHGAALFLARDQAGILEHGEMLHHRGQGHPERFGERADATSVLVAQLRKDRAPRRIGERLERARQGGVFILYHLVK
jgi:hypothetical protein